VGQRAAVANALLDAPGLRLDADSFRGTILHFASSKWTKNSRVTEAEALGRRLIKAVGPVQLDAVTQVTEAQLTCSILRCKLDVDVSSSNLVWCALPWF